MASLAARLFTRKDLDHISAAVHEAEKKTSGEVVPYLVEHSDHYDEAELRAALVCGLLPLIILTVLRWLTEVWIGISPVGVVLLTMLGMVVGWTAAWLVPPIKRFFAGKHLMDRRVAQRAAEAFISEEVFRTRHRTGILLFISVFERRVLVVGDSGINASVKKSDWDAVVKRVVDGIRTRRTTEGLLEAIAMCGSLLQKHGLTRTRDDTDELPDNLRIGK